MLITYTKIVLFIFIFTVGISYSYDQNVKRQHLLKSDLRVVLRSLEKLIKFTTDNKIDPNLNIVFGIFLISVNLERVLDNHNPALEIFLRSYMTILLETNNRNLKFLMEDVTLLKEPDMKIFAGMNLNTTVWANRITEFKTYSRKKYKLNFQKSPSLWRDYENMVINDDLGVPSPKMSDKCLSSFYNLPLHQIEDAHCEIDVVCYYIIRNGTNLAYALTHRLLPLLIARLGCNCTIFSPKEDLQWADEFCTRIYEEAWRIAEMNFFTVDLLMEQIALCSLNGRSEFFHRSWIFEILRYQTADGCFSNSDMAINSNRATEFHEKQSRLSDCGEHVTSVAAGMLSAAVRFIIEIFY